MDVGKSLNPALDIGQVQLNIIIIQQISFLFSFTWKHIKYTIIWR